LSTPPFTSRQGLPLQGRRSQNSLRFGEWQRSFLTKGDKIDKAYDPKALVAKLKGRGLDVAEEAAKVLVEETCSWLEESAKLSATPVDDIAAVLVPHLKSLALGAVDKIDGAAG
jgi:hypothetical protein